MYQEYRHALIWNGALESELELSTDAARNLIGENNCWMLRNTFDYDCGHTTNFWFLVKDSFDEREYSKRRKKRIETANFKFKICRITSERISGEGYRVYYEAHRAYKVNDGFVMDENDFKNEISSMNEDFEFWGCVDRETGTLEAYAVCHVHDGMCWVKYARANPSCLAQYYTMYGLYDACCRHYLLERKLNYVLNSARSITQHSNIEGFLIQKFGFRKAYCRIRMHYAWWLGIAVKILYPFRNIIPVAPVKNLLKLEQIARENNA